MSEIIFILGIYFIVEYFFDKFFSSIGSLVVWIGIVIGMVFGYGVGWRSCEVGEFGCGMWGIVFSLSFFFFGLFFDLIVVVVNDGIDSVLDGFGSGVDVGFESGSVIGRYVVWYLWWK